MQLGWRGWWKTVAVTVAVTSAFWIILGGWFCHRELENDGLSKPAQSPVMPRRSRQSSALPSGLVIPVTGVQPGQLVDTFAQARAQGERRHEAIDIMASEGTPVVAAAPGHAEKLFVSADGGNTVYVRSADGGTIYYYAHLRDYAPDLREGAELGQGAAIGTVGHSGNADAAAPHLHFAIMQSSPGKPWWEDAPAVNPYPLLTGHPTGSSSR